jgi:hypothetical protein
MGAIKSENKLYLNVNKGMLVNKKMGLSMYAYQGTLINIDRKDEPYEGKTISKVRVSLQDNESDQIAIIQFLEDSYYSLGFFQRLEMIDVFKPIIIGVSKSEQNEKVSFAWMKQNGHAIKVDRNAFVKPKKVSIGKDKFVFDWTECLERFSIIIDKVNGELTNSISTNKKYATSVDETEDTSDLPF